MKRELKQSVRVFPVGNDLEFRIGDVAFTLEYDSRMEKRSSDLAKGYISDDDDFVLWLEERDLLVAPRRESHLPGAFLERHDRTLRFLASYESSTRSALDMLEALHGSRVLVAGLGGVGSWITYSLLMSGVGTIIGADGDVVDASNLNRSAVYDPQDVGLSKALALGSHLAALFPDQSFVPQQTWITSAADVAALAEGADFVVSAADTPHQIIRMWVREGARAHNVPVIETMGGAIGPIRGPGGVDYNLGVSVTAAGQVQTQPRNLNAIARGPGVPPFHPMTDAAGVCQAIFEALSGARESPLSAGYVRKGATVNLGAFHEMTA